MADSWFGSTALPTYGCFVPTEDELHLFPALNNAAVLDLGCGSGHSLKWCADKGARELWGVDLSSRQLENARKYLAECGYTAALVNAPMENADLPENRFDAAYSIYAIGWTTDLDAVCAAVHKALKKGGAFIFSWDHPLMSCVDIEDDRLIFTGNATCDEEFSYIQRGQPVTVQNRRLSTYVNALAKAGFKIERIVEETAGSVTEAPAEFSSKFYSPWKAKYFPLSFIIKAVKV